MKNAAFPGWKAAFLKWGPAAGGRHEEPYIRQTAGRPHDPGDAADLSIMG